MKPLKPSTQSQTEAFVSRANVTATVKPSELQVQPMGEVRLVDYVDYVGPAMWNGEIGCVEILKESDK